MCHTPGVETHKLRKLSRPTPNLIWYQNMGRIESRVSGTKEFPRIRFFPENGEKWEKMEKKWKKWENMGKMGKKWENMGKKWKKMEKKWELVKIESAETPGSQRLWWCKQKTFVTW